MRCVLAWHPDCSASFVACTSSPALREAVCRLRDSERLMSTPWCRQVSGLRAGTAVRGCGARAGDRRRNVLQGAIHRSATG